MMFLSPEEHARALRYELKAGYGPIDLGEVCKMLDLQIVERNLGASGKVAGALVLEGKRGAILVNENVRYDRRKRFTIGHEIGHFCIPSHTSDQYYCFLNDLEVFRSNKNHETEANHFSSELLLPEVKAAEVVKRKEVNMSLISKVADDYGMSLTAVSIKLVKQSQDDVCTVVLSQGGAVKWTCESKSFGRRWQVRRKLLDPPRPCEKMRGNPSDWLFGSNLEQLREIYLEHIRIGDGAFLTLLTVPFDDTEEDYYDGLGEY